MQARQLQDRSVTRSQLAPCRTAGSHNLRDFHTDGHNRLHNGDGDSDAHQESGNAGNHVGRSGDHHHGRRWAWRSLMQARQLQDRSVIARSWHRAGGWVAHNHRDSSLHRRTTDYTTATTTVTLTVNQAMPAITWSAPAAITYGTALGAAQLNATANVAGTLATVRGGHSALAVGTQTLTAAFTLTDTTDYTGASASVSLTVNKATPAVTWPPPSPIVYGTALSSTQLDAPLTVAGSFCPFAFGRYGPGRGHAHAFPLLT